MKKLILTAALTALLTLPATAYAQEETPGGAKAELPTLATYPDIGEEFGMVWSSYGGADDPRVEFSAPETDNRMWLMTCSKRQGGVQIVHQLEAGSKEAGAGDRFGMTIRVDDKPSLGLIARMELTDGEGGKYYVPRFYTSNRHSLFEDLAKGNRAFIQLHGSKFSVHLRGSGEALVEFLRACQ